MRRRCRTRRSLRRGYFHQDKGKGFLTFSCQFGPTVQGGIPMTVQGKGAASPPCKRPEVRLPTLRPAFLHASFLHPAFILAANIPAGGSHPARRAEGWS